MLASVGDMAHRAVDLWKFFLVGILVAKALDHWQERTRPWQAGLILSLGIGLIAAVYAKHDMHRQAIMAVGVGALLYGAVTFRPAWRILGAPPLKLLGAVSYSIFLCHGLVIFAAFPSLALGADGMLIQKGALPATPLWFVPLVYGPAVLGLSALSFAAIERPFILWAGRHKKRAGSPPSGLTSPAG